MRKIRPKISDVARAARVSPATVSNALTENRHVDPETRDRVRAVAKQLGYTPNLRAQRLRTGQANTIAILSSMPFAVAAGPSRLGFLMEIAAVAAAAALEKGLALVLVPPAEFARVPIESLDISGAIVIEPLEDDPETARLRERGVPVVTIGKQLNDRHDLPFVDLHSAATARLMLQHLRVQSARRIALVIGQQQRNSYRETEQEYEAFARRHRMRKRVLRIDELGGEAAGHDRCRTLLAEHLEIDALCIPVDAFASGAVHAAAALGRSIPGDLKLITRYDGHRARESVPRLSAMNLHLPDIAAAAVDLLLAHIRGNSTARQAAGPLPELIPRESSVASRQPPGFMP